MYKYVTSPWIIVGSERDTEIRFLLSTLYDLFYDRSVSFPASLLDVGFAGSGYIEQILEFGNIDYTGLDGDLNRISGKTLRILERSKCGLNKEIWRALLKRIKYVEATILDYKPTVLYDIVISVSTIEHIMPMGYECNKKFDFYGDIQAVRCMEALLKKDGYLLLTFPCGKECVLTPDESFNNRLRGTSLENRVVKHRHHLLVYNEDRVRKVIGNLKVVKEQYWVNFGKGFEECGREIAYNVEYRTSDVEVKTLCTLLLTKK